MDVQRLGDVEAFEREAGAYLVAREAEHNLMLGLMAQLRAGEYAEQPPLLAVFQDAGRLLGCALQTPPHRLVLSMPASEEDASGEALAEALDREDVALPGVLGPPVLADAFAGAWCARRGLRPEVARGQRIYRLDAVTPPPRVEGEMRRATLDDRELVAAWLEGFERDTGEAGRADRAERWLTGDPRVRALHLWEVGGAPVSMAGVSGPTPSGIRIGAVYTPPELRRRGYATALVAALSQSMLDAGRRFCFLFTDLANPTSNHIYQTIGYRPVCDVHVWDFAELGRSEG